MLLTHKSGEGSAGPIRLRLSLATVFALLTIALLAACGDSTVDVESTPTPTPHPPVDRIAYVGDDGNVYTVKGDGTLREQVTRLGSGPVASLASSGLAQSRPSSYFAWPTWSPDGTRIAASRVVAEGLSQDSVDLRVIDLATGQDTVVFANNPLNVGYVAERAPHYPYWSPGGERVAFLASGASGLTLYTTSADGEGGAEEVASGAPLYFVWSPSGDGALLHVRDRLLTAEGSGMFATSELPVGALAFRAPGLSHDGERMAYVGSTPSGGFALHTATADGGGASALSEVEGLRAFQWSPSERHIAVSNDLLPGLALYDGFSVLDAETGNEILSVSDPTLAFAWSPDGSRLAYAALDPSEEWLAWKIAGLDGSVSRELVRFLPSQEMFIWLSFFDQYAHSHAVWSPDGSNLVFAGRIPEPDGTVRTLDQVIVLDADGFAEPRAIAEGTVAFWSWR